MKFTMLPFPIQNIFQRWSSTFNICLFFLTMIVSSACNDKLDQCARENTGTLRVTNSRPNGTVHVFVNQTQLIFGNSEATVPAEETVDIPLPAGSHNVQVYISYSSCTDGRCHVSFGENIGRDIDLNACEEHNIVY